MTTPAQTPAFIDDVTDADLAWAALQDENQRRLEIAAGMYDALEICGLTVPDVATTDAEGHWTFHHDRVGAHIATLDAAAVTAALARHDTARREHRSYPPEAVAVHLDLLRRRAAIATEALGAELAACTDVRVLDEHAQLLEDARNDLVGDAGRYWQHCAYTMVDYDALTERLRLCDERRAALAPVSALGR